MTIAQDVARACDGAAAYTLAGGYAVHGGKRALFEAARMEQEKRNQAGRCTHVIARYSDGSALRFRWSEGRGARLEIIA